MIAAGARFASTENERIVMVERKWPEGVYVRKLPSVDGYVYSQVTTANGGRSIHIAGSLPFDENQQFVGENDVASQTRQVLEVIRRSLSAAGAQPSDVVRTKTYVIDMQDYLENGIPEWVAFFDGKPPVSTTVGVTALADPRALVEIEAYAELD
jgi:enamine deaminase RidA (YjgF/YER057c/UK114 family)